MFIRKATTADIDQLAFLMGELGYPTTREEMFKRFSKINSNQLYNTLVAENNGNIVGMIGMILGYHYEKNENYVRIVALVVDSNDRGQGIGKKLIDSAEKWARENEANRLVLNSGNRSERDVAHQFYTEKGFEARATGYYKTLI